MASSDDDNEDDAVVGRGGSMEEDELGKVRFMELLSNCKMSEMILQRTGKVSDAVSKNKKEGNDKNSYRIPQIRVDGLADILKAVDDISPSLQQARKEIEESQSVSFHPGLGELFTPGSKLLCHPAWRESRWAVHVFSHGTPKNSTRQQTK
jgi:hypothetical protein